MINEVSRIFCNKIVVPIHQDPDGVQFLVVVEDGILSAIKRLHIKDLPNNSYAVSLDVLTSGFSPDEKIAFSRLNHYLDKSNGVGINKRCDLVIFVEDGDRDCVYVLDLKSADPDPNDSSCQLINSEIYIKYVLELAGFFYGKDVSAISFYKVICSTRVRKNTTYPSPEKREKFRRKNEIFNRHNIKEITVLPESNKNGYVHFNDIYRLF